MYVKNEQKAQSNRILSFTMLLAACVDRPIRNANSFLQMLRMSFSYLMFLKSVNEL